MKLTTCYDVEYRYDRQPVGALLGLDPDHVAYFGSTSKTLSHAVRLGWLITPRAGTPPSRSRGPGTDLGASVFHQQAVAHLISSGALQWHLRRTRAGYRDRRAGPAPARGRGRRDRRRAAPARPPPAAPGRAADPPRRAPARHPALRPHRLPIRVARRRTRAGARLRRAHRLAVPAVRLEGPVRSADGLSGVSAIRPGRPMTTVKLPVMALRFGFRR